MEIDARLTEVFREVFDDPKLEIEDHYTANEIPAWDSVAHVNLIVGIEEAFGIRFSTGEIASFSCVGDVKKSILQKSPTEA